jgi:hypothetical protein
MATVEQTKTSGSVDDDLRRRGCRAVLDDHLDAWDVRPVLAGSKGEELAQVPPALGKGER